MPNPNRQNRPPTFKSEQGVLNTSFDEEFGVLAVENLVYNPGTGNMDRMTQPGATVTASYENRNDTTTDTNLVYLGKAEPGSDPSGAVWQIKRYNKSAGHMSFADDATTFTKVWNDRVSYTY